MAITTAPYIINPSFENGDLTGWTIAGSGSAITGTIVSAGADASNGNYSVRFVRNNTGSDKVNTQWSVKQTDFLPVYAGQAFSVHCDIRPDGEKDEVGGQVAVIFADETETQTLYVGGSYVAVHQGRNYRTSTVSVTTPTWATKAYIVGAGWIVRQNGVIHVDNFRTTYTFKNEASLTSPANGAVYEAGTSVPFRINTNVGGATIIGVEYFSQQGADAPVSLGTGQSPDWGINKTDIAAGEYSVFAKITLNSAAVLTTNTNAITIQAEPVPEPDTREYKASNSYAYLLLENFESLASSMPLTAKVTGVEFDVSYKLHVLSRTKDIDVTDPAAANSRAPFDIANSGTIEVAMLSKSGDNYSTVGLPYRYSVPITFDSFEETEVDVSEDKKWTVMEMTAPSTAVLGAEDFLWEQDPIDVPDFLNRAFGFRFYPNIGNKPLYADSGDAVYRIFLDKIRIKVYFDAGSVEYYFASSDYTNIIKGTLVSSSVEAGSLRTADASGHLQLTADLEVVEGTQSWIGNDWTIHAAYPPSGDNKIGDVADIEGQSEVGMEYNGLPTQQQVRDNRSRYQFITANFYGDKDLNSIYGANGHGRGFAYNGDWFYKIYTQPSAEKDKPRHVAYHHWHLALGYNEGRVDISAVGEPYNFDGALGASSWTIGDQVVGLLPLSGTILGVFGAKSVWGISGTTVDNFATQTISPNIGATEYTITDMGMPVYANAYGVYTLSQTQEYGDYLGTPMSQDISPWLRPRLVRKYTTDREVEVAWPVRSKNQYRLAFSDGYVVSMTLNGQSVPTFSKQKYFLPPTGEVEVTNIYNQKAIVPAAVSSQLDVTGEERIHIAPHEEYEPPPTPVMEGEYGYLLDYQVGAS